MKGRDKMKEIYLLCMMFANETQIFGAFTNKEILIKEYSRLVDEDERCSENARHTQEPIIYKLPLNEFIGWKCKFENEERGTFFDDIERYEIDIDEIFIV